MRDGFFLYPRLANQPGLDDLRQRHVAEQGHQQERPELPRQRNKSHEPRHRRKWQPRAWLQKADQPPPPGWESGNGCFVAISTNDGGSWHIKSLPVQLPNHARGTNATLGYVTARDRKSVV